MKLHHYIFLIIRHVLKSYPSVQLSVEETRKSLTVYGLAIMKDVEQVQFCVLIKTYQMFIEIADQKVPSISTDSSGWHLEDGYFERRSGSRAGLRNHRMLVRIPVVNFTFIFRITLIKVWASYPPTQLWVIFYKNGFALNNPRMPLKKEISWLLVIIISLYIYCSVVQTSSFKSADFAFQDKSEVSTHTFLQDFILYFKFCLRATYGPQT